MEKNKDNNKDNNNNSSNSLVFGRWLETKSIINLTKEMVVNWLDHYRLTDARQPTTV